MVRTNTAKAKCKAVRDGAYSVMGVIRGNEKILIHHISDSQNDQLPVGLTTQLVEHCAGITRGHRFKSRSSL